MDPISNFAQFGAIGALVAQTWIVFKFLESQKNDAIAQLTDRVSRLESERESHHKRLEQHSQHKANKSHVERVVSRRLEMAKGGSKDQADD